MGTQAENSWTLASGPTYQRRKPEETILYKVIQENVNTVFQNLEMEGRRLPYFIRKEFDAFLDCGILAKGFLRVRCNACGHEKLIAFSCKTCGFCPSCLGRKMSDQAAHLVDHVFPERPVRQFVVTVPFALRYLFALSLEGTSFGLESNHQSNRPLLYPKRMARIDHTFLYLKS